ncbi:MAG TPA: pitrilysin family protein [Anaerolineae bacterium]|nr:pitrilysin family protein [Anaerolineae bacterium]
MAQFDNVVTRELSNGLRVILRPTQHVPVTSVWISYLVGSRHERPGQTGLAHWVEHMMFKGTPAIGADALNRMISREGGNYNAYTTLDYTTYYATVPSHQAEMILQIEADRMMNLRMTAEEVEAERTVILSERHMYENQPMFLLYEALHKVAFPTHGYHHDIIGQEEDLRRHTRDDLYQHYRQYYAPNQAVLVLVGAFEPEEMLTRVEHYFGGIEAAAEPPPPSPPDMPLTMEQRVVVKGPGDAVYMVFAYPSPVSRSEDFFALALVNTILTGGGIFGHGGSNKSSRLYQALVEQDLAVAVYGSQSLTIDPYLYDIGLILQDGQELAAVEAAFDVALAGLEREPITDEELAKAKKRARAQFILSNESVTSQAGLLSLSQIMGGHARWHEEALAALQTVTVEQVRAVAEKYLKGRGRIIATYEPIVDEDVEAELAIGEENYASHTEIIN